MLNTYIKNRGLTQTIIHKNNENQFNEINWDAIYDGNNANISVNSNKNGRQNNFNISLDNQDLANILNIPSVNMPLHKRLQTDFENPVFKHDPNIYQIQLPPNMNQQMFEESNPMQSSFEPSIENLLHTNHLSSPLSNEELIIPLTIDSNTQDNFILTPKRHHKHKKNHKTHKTHKTYKVYKKVKSSSPKSKSRKSKKSSKLSKSSSFSLF
jgi:hypothetical protein